MENKEKSRAISSIDEFLSMSNNDEWSRRVKRGLCRIKRKLGGYYTYVSFNKELSLYRE